MNATSHHQPPPNECDQTQEAIIAMMDHEPVEAQQSELLSSHLPNCQACRAYQQTMQRLSLSVQHMETVPVPPDLEWRIMERISEDAALHAINSPVIGLPTVSRNAVWPKMASVAAAIAVVALGMPLIDQVITPQAPSKISATLPSQNTGSPMMANNQTEHSESTHTFQFAPLDNTVASIPVTKAPSHSSSAKSGSLDSGAGAAPTALSQEQPAELAEQTTDPSEVASALPSPLNVSNTYASNKEGDIYFDPVSDLVEF